jgi:hypothetical protein
VQASDSEHAGERSAAASGIGARAPRGTNSTPTKLTEHHDLKQDVLATRLSRSRSWVRIGTTNALPCV